MVIVTAAGRGPRKMAERRRGYLRLSCFPHTYCTLFARVRAIGNLLPETTSQDAAQAGSSAYPPPLTDPDRLIHLNNVTGPKLFPLCSLVRKEVQSWLRRNCRFTAQEPQRQDHAAGPQVPCIGAGPWQPGETGRM